jgi:hypothetical protein
VTQAAQSAVYSGMENSRQTDAGNSHRTPGKTPRKRDPLKCILCLFFRVFSPLRQCQKYTQNRPQSQAFKGSEIMKKEPRFPGLSRLVWSGF